MMSSEFERDIIRERTQARLAAAPAKGRKGGRPKAMDEKKRKTAIALWACPGQQAAARARAACAAAVALGSGGGPLGVAGAGRLQKCQ